MAADQLDDSGRENRVDRVGVLGRREQAAEQGVDRGGRWASRFRLRRTTSRSGFAKLVVSIGIVVVVAWLQAKDDHAARNVSKLSNGEAISRIVNLLTKEIVVGGPYIAPVSRDWLRVIDGANDIIRHISGDADYGPGTFWLRCEDPIALIGVGMHDAGRYTNVVAYFNEPYWIERAPSIDELCTYYNRGVVRTMAEILATFPGSVATTLHDGGVLTMAMWYRPDRSVRLAVTIKDSVVLGVTR